MRNLVREVGSKAYSANPETITFAAAFPTACITAIVIALKNLDSNVWVVSQIAASFVAQASGAAPTKWNWIAIGY